MAEFRLHVGGLNKCEEAPSESETGRLISCREESETASTGCEIVHVPLDLRRNL